MDHPPTQLSLIENPSPDDLPGEPAGEGSQETVRKTLSVIENRLLKANDIISSADDPDALFQHSIFCQTCMPYRDPGEATRIWERTQGFAHLRMEAGAALNPHTKKWVDVGLPFGPKPRLIMAYLNTEALRAGSAEIEVQDSLTAFIKRLNLSTDGRSIRTVRDQLARLSASDFRLGYAQGDEATTIKATIIMGFNLWFPKDLRQRVLWPSSVKFSPAYFESLVQHAVPLNETALSALSHSAMGLDIYAWMAQRLHRVRTRQLVPWVSLHDQFGQGYARLRKFREVFTTALGQVAAVYPGARFDLHEKGMYLQNSPPPVLKKLITKP